jgi:hypothetical protein
MEERSKKAFDFAADLTKQLITLSTGIVTITLLFSKDLAGPRELAVLAWVFYLLSTLFGLWALMALTGTLAPVIDGASQKEKPDRTNTPGPLLMGRNVRIPSKWQILTFAAATILTLLYVVLAFGHPLPPASASPANCCSCTCSPATSKP